MPEQDADPSPTVWMQYPDATIRQTYPPLQTRGGNQNAEAIDTVITGVSSAHTRTLQQEAEFRARQYARRLLTRGKAAMREPEPPMPPPPQVVIPDDPLAQAYHAAGWL